MIVPMVHADSRARLGIDFRRTCKRMKSKVGVSGLFFNCFVVPLEDKKLEKKKVKKKIPDF